MSNVEFLLLEVFIKVANASRGKQCSFMSFSALLRVHSLAVIQWCSQTNDSILEEGDIMYFNALAHNRSIFGDDIALLSTR